MFSNLCSSSGIVKFLIFLVVHDYITALWHLAYVVSVLKPIYEFAAMKKRYELLKGRVVLAFLPIFDYLTIYEIIDVLLELNLLTNLVRAFPSCAALNSLHRPRAGLHTELFFEEGEVHSLGPAWTSQVPIAVETNMPKEKWFTLNPFLAKSGISLSKWLNHRRGFPLSFCFLDHFIIICVCFRINYHDLVSFRINVKDFGKTTISPSLLLLKCQSIHQLLIDSNVRFVHESESGR
ncbi:hypothetical protein DVH24_000042 [Malus domestica]|uniref:Uncharacterized protein n=1 Tax=Malus domestica TaxID=3750 RepID=A0A498J3L3_MALDO|nr:hypothetical protein DVH24_000042 [Malus domestica]